MTNVKHSSGVAAPEQKTEKTGNYTAADYSAALLSNSGGCCEFAGSQVFALAYIKTRNLISIEIGNLVQALFRSTACLVADIRAVILVLFPFSMRFEPVAIRAVASAPVHSRNGREVLKAVVAG